MQVYALTMNHNFAGEWETHMPKSSLHLSTQLQLLLLTGCHCSLQVFALGWAFVLEADMERVFSNAFYQWSSWKLEYSCWVVAGRSLKQSWAWVLHLMVSLGLLSCCFSSSSTKLADSGIFKRKKVQSILLQAFSTQVLDAWFPTLKHFFHNNPL
jgi:hypothetical protein